VSGCFPDRGTPRQYVSPTWNAWVIFYVKIVMGRSSCNSFSNHIHARLNCESRKQRHTTAQDSIVFWCQKFHAKTYTQLPTIQILLSHHSSSTKHQNVDIAFEAYYQPFRFIFNVEACHCRFYLFCLFLFKFKFL